MTDNTAIPLSKLLAWEGNVRKTDSDRGIDELAASITAHGLLQSLVVRKDKRGKYAVVAGRRRLLALQSLADTGTVKADMDKPDSFCVSFYGWPHADRFMQAFREAGFRVAGYFVFPKRYTSSQKYVRHRHECAYLLAKDYPKVPETTIGDVIDWSYTGNKLQPTQKPLPVLLPLVETCSAPAALVLDPFSGSGSFLLAAKMLGRSWLGIELDATYHEAACRRLESAN